MSEGHTHDRARFQLDRMILFSDAVFAIAITLLIIEIKVPELHGSEASEIALLQAIARLIPKFVGFLISFFIIGVYWTRHHMMFGYATRSTPRLVWLNLLFLLGIVLMPFSTGIFGEYSTPSTISLKTPLVIYVLNICYVGAMNLLLWNAITNPATGISSEALDPRDVRLVRTRATLVPLIFALVIPAAFVNPYLARYVPLIIPFAMNLLNRRMSKPASR